MLAKIETFNTFITNYRVLLYFFIVNITSLIMYLLEMGGKLEYSEKKKTFFLLNIIGGLGSAIGAILSEKIKRDWIFIFIGISANIIFIFIK